jgi:hypothetical protein
MRGVYFSNPYSFYRVRDEKGLEEFCSWHVKTIRPWHGLHERDARAHIPSGAIIAVCGASGSLLRYAW